MNLPLIKYKEKIISLGGLFFLVVMTIIFWPKFSSLLINSDSYVYILQAKFLNLHHSFSGQLGSYGDYLSPIFYRGGFSLVIYLLSLVCQHNYFFAGQIIVLYGHLFCLILVYFFISKLFRSHFSGFFSTLILLFSYSFSRWSTVLMPELPALFLLLLSCYFLFFSREKKLYFLLSPLILGLSVLFRGEMILLLIPIIFILIYQKRGFWDYFYYFFCVLSIWIIYATWLYQTSNFPTIWFDNQLQIINQTLHYHTYFLFSFLFLLIGLILYLFYPALIILMVLPFLYFLQKLQINYHDILPPLAGFLYHDFIIIFIGIIGLPLLIKKNKHLGGFFLFSILILFPLYLTRSEYRYYVHLIIFFLFPGGYFLAYCWHHSISIRTKILALIFFLIIISGQYYLFTLPNFLPTISYEQLVADQTKNVINLYNLQPSNTVICSVFSEAMYFSTEFSAIDCFAGQTDVNRQNTIGKLVVVDEDISRHQPEFVAELIKKYPQQPIFSQWLIVPYLEKNDQSLPKQQIKWFYLPPEPTI